jgi:hypothetical protein
MKVCVSALMLSVGVSVPSLNGSALLSSFAVVQDESVCTGKSLECRDRFPPPPPPPSPPPPPPEAGEVELAVDADELVDFDDEVCMDVVTMVAEEEDEGDAVGIDAGVEEVERVIGGGGKEVEDASTVSVERTEMIEDGDEAILEEEDNWVRALLLWMRHRLRDGVTLRPTRAASRAWA